MSPLSWRERARLSPAQLTSAILVSLLIWLGLWLLSPRLAWSALDLVWLTPALLASLTIWLLRAARLWALQICELRVALKVVAVHGGLLRVAPMRLGELSLPYLLYRWRAVPLSHSGALLIWMRLTELLTLCLASGLALLSLSDSSPLKLSLSLSPPALGAALIACVFTLLLSLMGLRPLLSRCLAALSNLGDRARTPLLRRLIADLARGHGALPELSVKEAVKLTALSGLIFISQLVLFGCLIKACGGALPWDRLTLGSACAHLAGVIPMPTIGSVGSHELGWALGFMWVGLPEGVALSSALVSQLVTLALALLWWALSLFLPLPSQECEGRSV